MSLLSWADQLLCGCCARACDPGTPFGSDWDQQSVRRDSVSYPVLPPSSNLPTDPGTDAMLPPTDASNRRVAALLQDTTQLARDLGARLAPLKVPAID